MFIWLYSFVSSFLKGCFHTGLFYWNGRFSFVISRVPPSPPPRPTSRCCCCWNDFFFVIVRENLDSVKIKFRFLKKIFFCSSSFSLRSFLTRMLLKLHIYLIWIENKILTIIIIIIIVRERKKTKNVVDVVWSIHREDCVCKRKFLIVVVVFLTRNLKGTASCFFLVVMSTLILGKV